MTLYITQLPPNHTEQPSKKKENIAWLEKQEYHWICKLRSLGKSSEKGLNSTIFDNTQFILYVESLKFYSNTNNATWPTV